MRCVVSAVNGKCHPPALVPRASATPAENAVTRRFTGARTESLMEACPSPGCGPTVGPPASNGQVIDGSWGSAEEGLVLVSAEIVVVFAAEPAILPLWRPTI